jgi:hypothetical protein
MMSAARKAERQEEQRGEKGGEARSARRQDRSGVAAELEKRCGQKTKHGCGKDTSRTLSNSHTTRPHTLPENDLI